MSDAADDALVEFLLRETGEYLQIVLRYDADSWDALYLSQIAAQGIDDAPADVNDLLDAFRDEGPRNVHLDRVFELDNYYCSLHLFGALVLLHFGQPDHRGIVFGYDPAAASHLTDFVAVTLPYIREAGLDDLDDDPSWSVD